MSVANAAAGGIHKEVASELIQYGGGEPVYTQANAAPRECSSINGKNGRVRQEKKTGPNLRQKLERITKLE